MSTLRLSLASGAPGQVAAGGGNGAQTGAVRPAADAGPRLGLAVCGAPRRRNSEEVSRSWSGAYVLCEHD